MAEKTAELVEEVEVEEVEGEEVEGEEVQELQSAPSKISDLEPKMKLMGTVKRIELYGAFVDIGVGANAILHISKLRNKVNRVSELLSVGDEIPVWIETVDPGREQVTVTMLEPLAVEWRDLKEGQVYTGTVTRLEKYGAFVDIGAEKDGLVHISELSFDYVKHPSEAVKLSEMIEVKIIGFNKRKRRIDLSRKALLESPRAIIKEEEIDVEEEEIALPTAMEIALRRAMSQTDSPDPSSSPSSSRRTRSGAEVTRETQEDILDRTLKLSQETAD